MRHDEALAIARDCGRESGFLFDFDGTLSDICLEPAEAVPVARAPDAVRRLARVAKTVGIVSARPVGFLEQHFAGVALYGLYGLERLIPGDGRTTDPEALQWLPAVEESLAAARAELPGDLLVEDKGLAMAVHYRTAPRLAGRVRAWAADRAERTGLRLQEGRMVAELKPPVERDKGEVVREQASGHAALWYFGDDVADLRAFQALDEVEAARDRFTGVRVAVENGETRALASAADLTVASPAALVNVVEEIIRCVSNGW